MAATEHDRPNLMVFPPLLLIATIALAAVLQWWWPLGVLGGLGQRWRIPVGAALMLLGIVLTALGGRTLVRRGTNVNPLRPALALATDGIFRWSRNPMYVGGGPLMLGLAIAFGIDWLLLLMIPSGLLLHFGVVRREERYLVGKFGEEYRRYCAAVPRYLPGLAPGHHQ
ncbi:methyltransferase family protein [Rhodoplanes sp. Z2-YC6860]|uniref:methyltransferase family protein n=1 Tax=Rhodoplanes sp. Z2-YC6860 TaxID=674703 RepID=UPI00078E52DE|nr:isoprenylcysteine carboxylmethyltransferase family protein [Rhodoplanes sp. Z2-YC6860]AMN38605.1 isoprenylcysteine carboxyl methyltransferase [Rhodoplanes sp. Z2-YC6860]